MAIRKSKKLKAIIEDKKKVDFIYTNLEGETEVRKNVEIHNHGYDKKNHSSIRAFEPGKGWRLFHNSQVQGLKETGKEFKTTRKDYNPGDRGMKIVSTATKKVPGRRKKK